MKSSTTSSVTLSSVQTFKGESSPLVISGTNAGKGSTKDLPANGLSTRELPANGLPKKFDLPGENKVILSSPDESSPATVGA